MWNIRLSAYGWVIHFYVESLRREFIAEIKSWSILVYFPEFCILNLFFFLNQLTDFYLNFHELL